MSRHSPHVNLDSMKGFVLGFITAVVLFGAAGYAYLTMGLADVRGDVPASRIEKYLVTKAVHAAVQRNAPELHCPVPPTDVNLITGGKMYLDQCARCHGAPGAPRSEANSTAPQFAMLSVQYTESQIFWIAKHGIRGTTMPSHSPWDSDEELWALAGYIKHMNRLPPHVKEELAKASPPQ